MQLSLTNFQGHAHSELDIEGLTVVTGKSNAGKSSIVRSLLWLINNKLAGTSFIKHGKKEANASFLGIIREKSPKHNRYTMLCQDGTGKDYDAVKSEVPGDISEWLNLGTANIQRQRDIDFLVGLTPTAAGDILDKALRLTAIGEMEAEAARLARETSNAAKTAKADLEAVKAAIEAYGWVAEAKAANERIDGLKANIADYAETYETAMDFLHAKQIADDTCERIDLSWVAEWQGLLKQWQDLKIQVNQEAASIKIADELSFMIAAPSREETWVPRASALVDTLCAISQEWVDTDLAWRKARSLEHDIAKHKIHIAQLGVELQQQKARMPALCKACGQPIRRDRYV